MPYRVLVIDDETAIREAIRMTLEYEGYRVDEARGGQDGLDKATKTVYDAILLDIKMQVLDGMEVLENLRDQHVPTPDAVVVTPPRSGSGVSNFHTRWPVFTSIALIDP